MLYTFSLPHVNIVIFYLHYQLFDSAGGIDKQSDQHRLSGHSSCFAAIGHSTTPYSALGVGGADRL